MSYVNYIPTSILSHLAKSDDQKRQEGGDVSGPIVQEFRTVVLFADVSGYTKMCEAMAKSGTSGNEDLSKNLNSYFELLVRTISAQGGDVIKYAGDAILVVWPPEGVSPPSPDEETILIRRACQCGLDIKGFLQGASFADGVKLSVKVGIGFGDIMLLHMGGVFARFEYLAVGDPLVQAFHAEHQATINEVILNKEAYEKVKKYFAVKVLESGDVEVLDYEKAEKRIAKRKQALITAKPEAMIPYIPTAVVPYSKAHDDRFVNEQRDIVVLFVNLGVQEEELVSLRKPDDFVRVHSMLRAVQQAVYKYEGSLNKFLMDDKGSTLVAVFGLPPIAHEDDSLRGVLSALEIIQALHQFNLRPSIGITTGRAFAGVVGTTNRKEYSVLGDTVNLSARLMQHATQTGAGVLTDKVTETEAVKHLPMHKRLIFFQMDEIEVKGKAGKIQIFKPMERDAGDALPVNRRMNLLLERATADLKSQGSQRNLSQKEVEEQVRQVSEAITQAVEAGTGCVIIECLPGLGSKEVITNTLAHVYTPHGSQDRRDQTAAGRTVTQVIFSAGSSLDYSTPYRVWMEVCTRLLELLKKETSGRRKFVRKLMENHPHVAVLNDVFDWNFEDQDELEQLSPGEREAAVTDMMVLFVAKVIAELTSKKQRVVIAIDNAVFLDNHSWTLAYRVAKEVADTVLIFVTRPMNLLFRGKFAPPVCQDYDRLRAISTLVVHERYSPATIGMCAAQALNAHGRMEGAFKVPKPLIKLITEKASGNPQYARDLVQFFMNEGLISLIEEEDAKNKMVYKRLVFEKTLCPSVKEEKEGLPVRRLNPKQWATPLPLSIRCMIGTKLDRLQPSELWLLKTGAILGKGFSLAIVKQVFPLGAEADGTQSLDRDVLHLVQLNILQASIKPAKRCGDAEPQYSKDSETPSDEAEDKDDYYEFVDGCMRDVILARILNGHQESLINKIKLVSDDFNPVGGENEESETAPEKRLFEDAIMEGVLRKKGRSNKRWKERYFVLWNEKLEYYDSKETVTKSAPRGTILFGPNTLAEISSNDPIQFQVTPIAGQSDGRKYQLEAPSPENANEWVDQMSKLSSARNLETSKKLSVKKQSEVIHRLSKIADGLISGIQHEDKYYQDSRLEGVMFKRGADHGSFPKAWRKRYCIMFRDKLIYYAVPPVSQKSVLAVKGQLGNPKGQIDLTSKAEFGRWEEEKDAQNAHVFFIVPQPKGKKFLFSTGKSQDECEQWLTELRAICVAGQTESIGGVGQAFGRQNLEVGGKPLKQLAQHSVKEGFLTKKKGVGKHSKRRYFVLFDDHMEYFVSESGTKKKGEDINLFRESVVEIVEDEQTFRISPPPADKNGKAYTLSADTPEEGQSWFEAVKKTAVQAPAYVKT